MEWSEELGDVVWPSVTTVVPDVSSCPAKILVFFFFAAMADTIISVRE
jgi:preprotein translocase subunit SecE